MGWSGKRTLGAFALLLAGDSQRYLTGGAAGATASS